MKKFKTYREAHEAYDKIARVVGVPFEQWLFDSDADEISRERTIECGSDAACFINYYINKSLIQESFWVCPLNANHKPLCIPVAVSNGLLNGTPAGAREVFRSAIWWNAACIIVAHNHPSGNPTPSRKDIVLTRTLLAASVILGIPLIDHIVVGSDRFVSIREDYCRCVFRGWKKQMKGDAYPWK